MKWFKHMSDMLEDTWVQDVFMAEHGISGYGFLCGIFEIYAKECGTDPGEWVTIPMATITRKLRVSSTKVQRWLNDCSTAGKLSFEISLRELRICIPKMQALRDEWADRKNRELGSCSGVTPVKEERRKKEEYTPLPPKGEECGSEKKSEPKQEITFPKSPAGELVGYLREKLVKKGLTATSLNQKWAEIGVNEANILLKTESADEIRNAIDWFDSDERFWGKALNRMSHIRKHWDQYQRGKPDSSKASSKTDRLKVSELLKFPFIMYVPTNEIIPSSEMQYREDSPNGLYRGVNTYYPGGHLCGIESASVGDTGNGRHGTSAPPQPCGA